jgi:hypothetical protein
MVCGQCDKNNLSHLLFLTQNSESFSGQILALSFFNLNDGKEYGFFQQDGATAHTVSFSLRALRNVFG